MIRIAFLGKEPTEWDQMDLGNPGPQLQVSFYQIAWEQFYKINMLELAQQITSALQHHDPSDDLVVVPFACIIPTTGFLTLWSKLKGWEEIAPKLWVVFQSTKDRDGLFELLPGIGIPTNHMVLWDELAQVIRSLEVIE